MAVALMLREQHENVQRCGCASKEADTEVEEPAIPSTITWPQASVRLKILSALGSFPDNGISF